MQKLHALLFGAMLALTPALSHAQLPVSTGAQQSGGRDTRWQVAFGVTGGPLSAFSNAFVITNPVWGNPSGASWIGAAASSTVPGGNGSLRGMTYVARTQFTLNAGDQLTYRFQCTFDNIWIGLFVNNTQVGTTACGGDLSAQLAPEFTVGPSSFAAGLNSVEFRWQGDGTTDGIVIRSSTATTFVPGNPGTPGVVPEPSTYALMATGLAGLVGIARRRKQA